MKKKDWNFDFWCRVATAKIRYKPDREAVSDELRGHLEDAYDAYITKGLTPDEAEAKALETMGKAEDIAPQLAAIHKPWLGYLYSLLKGSAILATALVLFCLVIHGVSTLLGYLSAAQFDSLPANYDNLNYYFQPNVSEYCDGYRFRVTEAGYIASESSFYFELEILHWPWMDPNNATDHIWAIDSCGRYYSPISAQNHNGIGRVQRLGSQSSSYISLNLFSLCIFDRRAEWVELHYDRDGRDIVLRIDLTGGAENE